MPKIDANNIDCPKDNSHQDGFKVLNATSTTIIRNNLNENNHSPKVFTADSVTVNTPAKDVLGSKFNNFTQKNLKQQNAAMPAESAVLIEVNKASNSSNGHLMMNGNGNGNGMTNGNLQSVSGGGGGGSKSLQPLSACYDRYPKPGSYGSIQVYPMNGINSEINNAKENVCTERVVPPQPPPKYRPKHIEHVDDEISRIEQDRLEEILKMCADFERQNQNVQSSPVVQNRIKTNGSLPREKKSPMSPDHMAGTANIFFPSSPGDLRQINPYHQPSSPQLSAKSNSGYENVQIASGRKIDILSSPSSHPQNGCNQNGYENVMATRKSPATFVPQSPRTRIKTCISPKRELTSTPIQRKTDYDLLVQSFEEKLRLEIQQLRDSRSCEKRLHPNEQKKEPPTPPAKPIVAKKPIINGQYSNLNRSTNAQEGIYGTLTTSRNKPALKVNIKKNLDENQIAQLKRQQVEALRNARDLRTQISELQRQEEEVLRELELEKALVAAELTSEQEQLDELETDLAALQTRIHRMEAQRNANRVLQETQQNKLKQSIDMKLNQVEGLKKMLTDNEMDDTLRDELNETTELLENDTKTFEDLEFQYLEEETEWLAYREDLHSEQRILTSRIAEKKEQIEALDAQGIENQACADTKQIEKKLWSMLKRLERYREELKTIDTLLYELSGEKNTQSDSDDDVSIGITTRPTNDIMSQSLFGSQEILITKKNQNNDLMSKSLNENLFSNKIEMLPFTESTTKDEKLKNPDKLNGNTNVNYDNDNMEKSTSATPTNDSNRRHSLNGIDSESIDSLQKLKYNLSPPFDHKSLADEQASNELKKSNLNLSIESDDFEVNPLEKRVPSQDDIDRICKVTTDAPISTQGASYKVIESIKEIERNRQLLLAQQGSHVIEHERQKMSDLKKKSHDEARAQYLQLQTHYDDRYRNKNGSLENVNGDRERKNEQHHKPTINNFVTLPKDILTNSPRHSHPEYDSERPLSEVNSEISYDALSDKQFKSSNDIHYSNARIYGDHDGSGSSQRGSMMSSENSESGRMISGARRNLPKHQRPLTRYLPIMSADLDLRLHIESAGHQVTLCPHVKVDSYSCRGYLHKLGATFHGWSKRWFVLDRQKMALIYYSDKSERKPRGGAYFSTIDEVYLDHLNTSKSGRPHCTFIVKTKRRSYHLQAPSDATARIWIDAIITGAQGNIDY